MKPLVITAALLLLSSSGCSKAPAQEQRTSAWSPAPAPVELARAPSPDLADLLDPAPSDTLTPTGGDTDAAPSPEEVAAFRAPVPK
jgi:hypothetical protein